MMIEPPIDELTKKAKGNKYVLSVIAAKRAKEIETTRRAAKLVDSKLAESVLQVKPIVQPQSVSPTATIAPPPESQTMQDLETKLESIAIDSTVIHKKFGKGTVVKINKNEKFIHIKFTLGEKKFIFPDAFLMGFLKVE